MRDAARCTLYGETLWISPYVFSSFVVLHEKAISFEVDEVSLLDNAQQTTAYRERSLTAKVPMLEDNGFCIAESSAIAEYLEDAYPPPQHARVFPVDARDRARARMLMAWFRSDLVALREERPTTTMFYERATRPLSTAGVEAAARLVRVADSLVRPGADSLFGAWGLADSELAFMLHRLILNGDEVPERLRAYAQAQWQRPTVRAFVEHPRPAKLPREYWLMPAHSPDNEFARAAREEARRSGR
jgi:glutathione S-transferase